jgi:hypothetical protein
MDAGTDVSLRGEGNDRWDFFGRLSDFRSTPTGIPYYAAGDPSMPAACQSYTASVESMSSLNAFGCYAKGNSVMIPPAFGTQGTIGRNVFRDTGLQNVDLSIVKNWQLGEHWKLQFRTEFFNVLKHPNFANPFGGQNGWAHNDPSHWLVWLFVRDARRGRIESSDRFGWRALQFGLKLRF